MCISLMSGDFENHSCALWPFICPSSLGKCLFRPFAPVLLGLFIFLLLNYKSSLCILDTSFWLDIGLTIIFFYVMDCFFTFLVVSVQVPKLLIFMMSDLSILKLLFVACAFGAKKPLPHPRLWRFTLVFSSKSFIVLAHTNNSNSIIYSGPPCHSSWHIRHYFHCFEVSSIFTFMARWALKQRRWGERKKNPSIII